MAISESNGGGWLSGRAVGSGALIPAAIISRLMDWNNLLIGNRLAPPHGGER